MSVPRLALSVVPRVGAALGLMMWLAGTAAAQPTQGPPNALQGFSQNRGQPINIESVSLEVRDKEKVATFIDNVKLVQGDTTLECKVLVVYYDEDLAPGGSAAARPAKTDKPADKSGDKSSGQQIRRLEAKGGVVVTQKDQTATGDTGVFDMKTNTVTLIGNVLISQGLNVVKGDRLWVDLTTNVSRVESKDGSSGRVNALFQPGAARDAAKASAPAPAAAKPAAAATGSINQSPKNAARAASAGADKDKSKEPGAKPLKLN